MGTDGSRQKQLECSCVYCLAASQQNRGLYNGSSSNFSDFGGDENSRLRYKFSGHFQNLADKNGSRTQAHFYVYECNRSNYNC